MALFESSVAQRLATRLLWSEGRLERRIRKRLAQPNAQRRAVDLVINANELTSAHGTGVVLGRLLKQAPDFVLFRAFDSWSGTHTSRPVAEYAFGQYSRPRAEIAEFISARLPPWDVGHILSVPYTREDVVMAIAAKSITGADLSIWIMDDNSLVADGVPRALMQELVGMADARFAISPSLQRLYADAYDRPFHLLPPLVASELIRCGETTPPQQGRGWIRAAMVGNVWSQSWLDRTFDVLSQSGVETDWYTSADQFNFLEITPQRLAQARVSIRPGLDALQTARRVASAHFVVSPSTDMAETTPQAASIGRMSLPSKLPFITAAAGAPILVLANGPSGAADYVRHFDLGEVSTYDPIDLESAIGRLTQSDRQTDIRRRSQRLAYGFDVAGVYPLITETARKGRLVSDRFERLFTAFDAPRREILSAEGS